jgi:serine/threonine-protein kinase
MDWPSVLQIAQQLSDALLAAHSNGLIHRDVKPGNVLLEADGSRALLTDFGLVRALDEATLTRSGMLTGTPDYMSPEQARGETVTPSSDLFSLGALLYTMLTGNPPFRASDPMAVMNRICHARHRSLVATHPEVPVEISRLVDKLLAKDPKRRYTSAAELRSQLQRLSQAPLHLEAQRKLASHVGWLCGAVGLLLLAAVTAWSFWNSATAPPIPTMVVGPSTQQVQPSPPSSPSTAGFEDLRQLDQNLQQLNARVQNLADEFSSYEREPEFTRPLPGAGLDQPLRQLDQTLRELELEMSATETWHIASPP